jgi:hypothetical protein
MPELLTPEKTADLLGIKKQTLAVWRLKGSGPAYIKAGYRVLYSLDEINAWLAARTRTSTSEAYP